MKYIEKLYYRTFCFLAEKVSLFLLLFLVACQEPGIPEPANTMRQNQTIAEAQQLFQAARQAQKEAKYAVAIDGFKQCLRFNETATDSTAWSALATMNNEVLLQLMNSYQSLGQPEACAACFDSLLQRPSNQLIKYNWRTLHSIAAYALSRTEDMEAAEILMDRALALPASQDPKQLFRDYAYAAAVFFSNPKRQEEVIRYAKLGIEQAKLGENISGFQYLTSLLGTLYKRMGRVDEAIDLFEESIKESHNQQNLLSEANSYNSLAELLLYWELYVQAEQYVDKGIALIQQIEAGDSTKLSAKNPMIFGGIYLTKGQIVSVLGTPEEALSYYQQAETYLRDLPYNSGKGNLDVQLGALAIDHPELVTDGKARLERAAQEATISVKATALYHLARWAIMENRPAEAEQLMDQIYDILHHSESPTYLPGVYYDLALEQALKGNDPDRIRRFAKAFLEEMKIYNDQQYVRKVADMLGSFYMQEQQLKLQLVQAELRSKQLLWVLSISVSILVVGILLLFFVNRVKVYKMRQRMADQRCAILLTELSSVRNDLEQSRQRADQVQQQLENATNENQLMELLSPDRSNLRREGEIRTAFTQKYPRFLEHLHQKAPQITSREEFTCILIALHQTSDQMSELMSISLRSVNTMRYRVRTKLQLESSMPLEQAIHQILQESEG